ncbi:hypothetical protein [Vallitalea sp.]|jgi:hypothetical protein|uniref:hypothetical protein n=1 Tax=Vallitalea sp. TaxID=1882829 RepID=UPI0025F19FDD|nr:hypothetical protein [Vallitalea sp.]MCT4688874.1 hypothetical protein [Vallitalea sp.]
MYKYLGKSLDGFQGAMQMLFHDKGYGEVKDIDCIALRNCSMEIQDNMSFWFSPLVKTEEAINNLKNLLEIKDYIKVKKITNDNIDDVLTFDNQPFVLGPINKKRLYNKVDTQFYDGNRHYVYCFLVGKDRIIHEPDGVPYMMIGENEILNFLKDRNNIYKINLEVGGSIKQPTKLEILKRWIIRKRELDKHPHNALNFDFNKITRMSSSNELQRQYALQNYMIQTYKLINLLDKNTSITREDVFHELAERISQIAISGEMEMLSHVIGQVDQMIVKAVLEEIDYEI